MGVGLIQPMHLLLILGIVLVVFGAGKLSQVGGALGQSVKEFKQAVDGEDGELPAAAPPAESVAPGKSRLPIAPETGPAAVLQREEI